MRAMTCPNDLPAMSCEALLAVVAEWQRQISELRAEIEQLAWGAKRQSAPFSRGSRVTYPKHPEGTPGASPFRFSGGSPPEVLTEPPVAVRIVLEACSTCDGLPVADRVN
jgi:hypothetical protein